MCCKINGCSFGPLFLDWRAVRVHLEVAGDHSVKKSELTTAYYKVFLLLACWVNHVCLVLAYLGTGKESLWTCQIPGVCEGSFTSPAEKQRSWEWPSGCTAAGMAALLPGDCLFLCSHGLNSLTRRVAKASYRVWLTEILAGDVYCINTQRDFQIK